MSRKQFSILLALAVIATLAVLLFVPGQTGRETGSGDGLLLPGASAWINDVSRVSIQRGEDTVTLERMDEGWKVAELQGYPADWSRLRGVLASLAEGRVLERKTDNPAYYDRLGVEDPTGDGAGGVLLRLEHGEKAVALVVGKAASSGSGQYLRLLDEAGSVLVDQELDLPTEAVDWAEREIVDVASSTVKEVEILHPDGDWIRVEKQDPADSDFTLSSLPEGRDIASSWSVNSLGGALSALRMEDVQPLTAAEVEAMVRFRLLTFDGVEYTIEAWEGDDHQWIRPEASVVVTEPTVESGGPVNPDVEANVEAFNRQVSGWRFRIPGYKYDTLTKRSEDLLQPLEEDADSETP